MNGRLNWRQKLQEWERKDGRMYWFHAASLGEFEQGLPVIEALKKFDSGCSIAISFFSPSGYEIRKDYRNADLVFYLPLDTRYNAASVVSILKPDAVFFIKYEFWHFFLDELKRRNIPVFLLSGIFRPDQVFFRWYGRWFRKNLFAFRHLFVQNARSEELLGSIKIKNTSITGDTRFDRVAGNALKAKEIPVVYEFSANAICIVAGSTWPVDEALLVNYINDSPYNFKFIIAPHEIDKEHINRLITAIKKDLVLYSHASSDTVNQKQVLIIDNIGMLSSVYRYGTIAYIGGGFGKGIHNILEAAVYGIPVIFGPNYHKFREAGELISAGGGFSVSDGNELKELLDRLALPDGQLKTAAKRAADYIKSNTGATEKIMSFLKNELKSNNITEE